MLLSNQEFIDIFTRIAQENDKVFVPDAMDLTIGNNIIVFFDNHKENAELLEQCILSYMRSSGKIVVTTKEFANNLDKYYYSAIDERESSERFRALLRQTQKRMTQFES